MKEIFLQFPSRLNGQLGTKIKASYEEKGIFGTLEASFFFKY
jgi:hypothetical protein